MTNNLVSAIKALMEKYSIASMIEQLTIVQAIDSNNDQIQENTADIAALEIRATSLPLYTYKAVINQSGLNAPEARVMVNTYPSGVLTYTGVGVYSLELGASLVDEFTTTTIQQTCYNGTTAFNINGYPISTAYTIETYDNTRVAANEMLADYTLIIETYA